MATRLGLILTGEAEAAAAWEREIVLIPAGGARSVERATKVRMREACMIVGLLVWASEDG